MCAADTRAALLVILDARNTNSEAQAIKTAIHAGSCVAMSDSEVAISNIKDYRTKLGNPYSCFTIPEMGTSEFCASSKIIRSVEFEKKNRTGAYTVAIENDVMIKAICKESGTVLIHKNKGTWTRTSLVFAQELPVPERLAPKNKDLAIRQGCKGADYAPSAQ